MYRVIVYGVYAIEMRRQIEHFLDDGYSIIGYSDAYLDEDIVDGNLFIPIDEIRNTDYDYVILAAVKEKTSINALLGLYGVPAEKIVCPEILLWSSSAKMQRNIVNEIDKCEDKDIHGLIFGLSYSRRGIVQKKFAIKCFNYSCPGMDIYYNSLLFKYTLINRADLIEDVRYAFWVMPYYYFDYDMSISLSQYSSGQICSITELNDWHNAHKNPLTRQYIDTFKMFSKKIMDFYHSPASPVIRKVWDGENRGVLQGNWNRRFLETCNENVITLRGVIDELKRNGCTTIIIVPPMYVEGMTSASAKAFYDKQKLFYQICNDHFGDVELWDYSEEYKEKKEFFDSLDHLNAYGAQDFTMRLNERLLDSDNTRRCNCE